MSEAVEYWEDRESLSRRAVDYARTQLARLALTIMQQLPLPIEEALDDEEREAGRL